MKKVLFLGVVIITILSLTNCGNSSESKMIDLEIRPRLTKKQIKDDARYEAKQYKYNYEIKNEEYIDVFTVLPGPYEITWNGNDNSATIKIKLRLNKTLKPGKLNECIPSEENEYFEMHMDAQYEFIPFNEEGKTIRELGFESNNKPFDPFRVGESFNGYNKDNLLDFYYFLTGKPGTELDLTMMCHNLYRKKEFKESIEHTKGMYIEYIGDNHRWVWDVE